jgi:DnaJ-class molecular chaperone
MIDPWQVLGVKRGASEKEIKEAYRKLIKENHPDINPNADPEKIKLINEAYELLTKKREQYESISEDFSKKFRNEGFVFDIDDIFHQFFFNDVFKTVKNVKVDITLKEYFTGCKKTLFIKNSDGTTKKIDFDVPANFQNGSVIALNNYVDNRKERINVKLNVVGNSEFTVDGDMLIAKKIVNVLDLIKGTSVEIKSPDDESTIKVKIKPGSSVFTYRIKGKGLYRQNFFGKMIRGDIFLEIVPFLPDIRQAKNKEKALKLLEELKSELDSA